MICRGRRTGRDEPRQERKWPGMPAMLRRSLWLPVATLFISTAVTASGPVAPELSSFAPLEQAELVDRFSGDFRYSVPLMEVPGPSGGYPIVLSYASGIAPDQDASWVGLGWTLSPGAIVRQMRGMPDEFAGDEITTIDDIDPNVTYGLGIEGNYELFGADSSVGTGLTAGLTGYFDNYRGFGITHTIGLSGQTKNEGTSASVGLNLGEDSLEGAKVAATASLSLGDNMRFGADAAFDASRGLSALSFSAESKYQSASYLVSTGNTLTYLGYARPAALPATQREMQGSNIKATFKIGGEVYGNYISGKMFGYYNDERLRANKVVTRGFGFLHLDQATPADALDFNREHDGALHEQSPNLALPVLTNDLFIVSGRDMVGTFRAYRNDVPVVFDPQQKSEITGGAIGVDVGFGNVVKVGLAGALNHTTTVIQRWDDRGAQDLLTKIQQAFPDDPTGNRERTYFKFIGEPSSTRPSIVPGSPAPVAASLQGAFDAGQTPPQYFTAGTAFLPAGPPANDERVPRASLIQSFTNGELREMANALPEFKRDFAPLAGETARRDNHIGAFRVTATNGTRYAYGIAVYNTGYAEYKFSVDRKLCPAGPCPIIKPPPPTTAAVAGAIYDYKVAGSEKLLEVKSLPAYPTSYLLTAILGTDYIDADGIPGPSDGDFGYWVRFNYVRDQDPQGKARPFAWRIPFVGASFVRGPDNGRFITGTERLGDKGFVTYGERESWYLDSIETSTHKAFLCTSRTARLDAGAAASAGQNTAPANPAVKAWRLDGVRLFSKTDLPAGASCNKGSPLIDARLEYDNSLAKGTPNAAAGKLTLKKLYFTHLDSKRGRLSPYTFDYEAGAAANNPVYTDDGHDRWGTYRDRTASCVTPAPSTAPQPSPALIDDDMPTCQNSNLPVDQWSSAWDLRQITEPTGRVITVDYEADDYAFVQDKAVTRLFSLTSVTANSPGSGSDICPMWSGPFRGPGCGAQLVRNGSPAQLPRIYFKLESPLPANDPRCTPGGCDAWVDRHYLGGSHQLYFRIRVALKRDSKWQPVSGYVSALRAGRASDDIGWIDLSPVHSKYPSSLDYHPLAHAAWQYLRLQQPELIRDGGMNGAPGADPVLEAVKVLTLVDAIPDVIAMLTGVYPRWASDGWGGQVDLAHSWIRLQDPDGIKKGGGSRVHRITLSDRWNDSTGGQEPELKTGNIYTYRLPDGRSSGVASYEPMVAGEENAMRQAKPFTEQVLLSSNYNLFAELPIAESHFPSPTVGYSQVVQRSLAAQADIDARRTAGDCQNPAQNARPRASSTGPTVYEFYTARDFPVRSAETMIDKRRPPVEQIVLIPLLGEITMSSVTASQGYSTVVNDMHGKQRRVARYEYTSKLDCTDPANPDHVMREEPVTETVYRYRSTGGFGTDSASLSNDDVATLVEDPKTQTSNIAEQADFVVDLRQNRTESFDGGINLNVDTFLVAIYPLPIPVPMPNFGYSLSETKTVVTSRVVHRAGILESVNLREGSARITTRTDRFDPLTGSALLSISDNAYGKPVYSYSMPARWSNSRMGAGYLEVGRKFDLTGGVLDGTKTRLRGAVAIPVCTDRPSQQPDCLPLGTELATTSANGGARLTFLGLDAAGTSSYAVQGDTAALPASAVVVRSGNRNDLVSTTDTIRALNNPLDVRATKTCTNEGITIAQSKIHGVLDVAHTSFYDEWASIARDLPRAGGPVADDDFSRGLRGIFRPSREYAYLTERSQSTPVDLSRDGTYDLVLFGTGQDPATCETGWVRKILYTDYSASGFDTEQFNALSVPSATLYGERGKLLIAAASNATRVEIGYDGFETDAIAKGLNSAARPGEGNIQFLEEKRCTGCPASTLEMSVVTDVAHTGLRSLKIRGDAAFKQPRLQLVPGKRYLLSGWVSLGAVGSAAADVPTYARGGSLSTQIGIRVAYEPAGSSALQTLLALEPSGPIIEGWQRMEGSFDAPANGEIVWLQFMTRAGPPNGRLSAKATPVYFDDLRLHPEDSSLQSFVYDVQTLRITARLDENNFATFFRYTPDGNVDLVRRETVRGIFAEQEGRQHVREHP